MGESLKIRLDVYFFTKDAILPREKCLPLSVFSLSCAARPKRGTHTDERERHCRRRRGAGEGNMTRFAADGQDTTHPPTSPRGRTELPHREREKNYAKIAERLRVNNKTFTRERQANFAKGKKRRDGRDRGGDAPREEEGARDEKGATRKDGGFLAAKRPPPPMTGRRNQ